MVLLLFGLDLLFGLPLLCFRSRWMRLDDLILFLALLLPLFLLCLLPLLETFAVRLNLLSVPSTSASGALEKGCGAHKGFVGVASFGCGADKEGTGPKGVETSGCGARSGRAILLGVFHPSS